MTMTTTCAICGIQATQLCSGCKSVVYCGRDHQKEHWKRGHKQQCKCYEITSNAVLGRHLRATRDIQIGEIIMRESPLIIGPKVASVPICLGCHRNLLAPEKPALNYYKCRQCTWPLCGVECESSSHHIDECRLMANSKFQPKINYNAESGTTVEKMESVYCVIMVLRCMQLKQTNPTGYAQFNALESHLQARIDTPLYKVLRANLITFVKTVLGLQTWSELDIMRIPGILDTNAFELRQPNERRKIRGVYPNAAMFSHDCVANARHTFDSDMRIIFLAKNKIAKGEIISISYTQPLRSTIQRRVHLKESKCFACTCARCTDPTELGTFAGAILCAKCKVGKIISTNPLHNAAVWQCQLCNQQKTAREFAIQDAALQQELETLDKSTPSALEDFIYRHRITLHDTNTHVLQAKYALTQLYGNAPGYGWAELDDETVQRKLELCEELLQLAELLDGRWSIFRGNLLLDLEETLVAQATREPQSAERDAKLSKAAALLEELGDIMKLQPEMTKLLAERQKELAVQKARFATPSS